MIEYVSLGLVTRVEAESGDSEYSKNMEFHRIHVAGRIHGLHQTLPFYQEIEFYPSPAYSGRIRQLELTFVTSPTGVEVVLEFDKRLHAAPGLRARQAARPGTRHGRSSRGCGRRCRGRNGQKDFDF